MNTLRKLEQDAQDRHAHFSKTLLEVQSRLTLSGLASETLQLVSPQYTRLRIAYSVVKRNPILAAGVVAGAGWLFKQAVRANGHVFKLGRKKLPGASRARPLSSRARTKR